MSIIVSNIQRMCFDDGPGVRTTVFVKGCGIACPWCANPESISFGIEADKGLGKEYTPEELVEEVLKDQMFWGIDGGVTFSGGEALMQAQELEEVWRLLKEKGAHLAVETSLFVPRDSLVIALRYIDFFYVDIKILEYNMCKQLLGGDAELYKNNVVYLASCNADIHFRIPCAKEHVLQEKNWNLICEFLQNYREYPVEMFAIHDLGRKKYEKIDRKFVEFEKLTEEQLEKYAGQLREQGCEVSIIRL